MQSATGSAVLVFLNGIESLKSFLRKLFIASLGVQSFEQFEIVPIKFHSAQEDRNSNITSSVTHSSAENLQGRCQLNQAEHNEKERTKKKKQTEMNKTFCQAKPLLETQEKRELQGRRA